MSMCPNTPRSRPVAPSRGVFSPLTQNEISISGGFWGDLRSLNASTIMRHAYQWMTRLGWIENFHHAASGERYEHKGMQFADSEAYKLIEALSWAVHDENDAELRSILDDLIDTVLSAQEPDGYLHTLFGRAWQAPRYSDMQWGHELYCFGHFIQAAIANRRALGEEKMFAAARRLADHVCVMFGDEGYDRICGHPEIEVALVELFRESSDARYLDQARLFLKRRGRGLLPPHEFGRGYWQDDEPIAESVALHGHAVRALYLAAGAIDASIESHDDHLFDSIRRQWERTLARRTYITGGMGSHHMDEAFGEDFVLPPDRSYCETCAGVAGIMVAWRLLLATGDSRHGDTIERLLYNIIATSPAEDGRSFFYANTLHQRSTQSTPSLDSDGVVIRGGAPGRQHWFEVSCCPPNLARTLASLNAFVATSDEDGVQIHQYVPGAIRTDIPKGPIELRMETDYPSSGSIVIHVDVAPTDGFTLKARIPRWADGATIMCTEGAIGATPGTFASLVAHRGDRIELRLPKAARVSVPDPRIDAVRGTIAIERGPEVLAVESIDLPDGWNLDDVTTDGTVWDSEGRTLLRIFERRPVDGEWPYVHSMAMEEHPRTADVPLVAYHDWAERGPSTMRVFIPLVER